MARDYLRTPRVERTTQAAKVAAVKKALPGKAFAVGLVLALIGIIAALVWGYLAGRTLRGDILVELPIPPSTRTDQERVLVRRGFDQRRHLFLLRERDGHEVWPTRVVLYGLQEGTTPVIAGDLLLVRTRRSSGLHETHAFRVDTGEFVWTGATPLAPLDSTGAPGPTLFLDDVVTEVYEGDPGELIGVNRSDGAELYRQSVRIAVGADVVLDGQIVRVPGSPPLCFSQRSGAPTDCAP